MLESQPTDDNTTNQIDLAGLIKRRLWILMIALLVGLSLGYVYYLQQTKLYRSLAKVYIERISNFVPADSSMLSRDPAYDNRTFLATQREIILGPDMIQESLAQKGFTGSIGPQNAHSISRNLTAIPSTKEGNSNVLIVTYQNTVAADCPKVLEAILDGYRAFVRKEYEDEGKQTVVQLEEAKKMVFERLDSKRKEYRQFQESAPLAWHSKEARSVHEEQIINLERDRQEALSKLNKLRIDQEAIEQAVSQNSSPEALVLLVQMLRGTQIQPMKFGGQAENNTLQAMAMDRPTLPNLPPIEKSDLNSSMVAAQIDAQLIPLLVEQQQLLAKRGPDHPDVAQIQEKIKMTRDALEKVKQAEQEAMRTSFAEREKQRKEFIKQAETELNRYRELMKQNLKEQADKELEAARKFVENYLVTLRQEVQVAEKTFAQVDLVLEEKKADAKKVVQYLYDDEMRRKELEDLHAILESYNKGIEIQKVNKSPFDLKYKLLLSPTPAEQIEPQALKSLGLGSLLGLLMGFGLAYLVELADMRFRNPTDILNSLGLQVFGHIPAYAVRPHKGTKTPLNELLVTLYSNGSQVAESYRAIRANLMFGENGEQRTTIQVTSPTPGDGKTTTIANLAVTFAQSGKRVLLIDCDLRRPTLTSMFSMSDELGLSDYLSGDIAKVPRYETGVNHLTFIPAGGLSERPAELLTGSTFPDLIQQFKLEYDLILIDSPPVLAVSDPLVISSRVDGVLIVLRIGKENQQIAAAAAKSLKQVGANLIGVVVNAISPKAKYGYQSAQKYYKYYTRRPIGQRTTERDPLPTANQPKSNGVHKVGANGASTKVIADSSEPDFD